MWHVQKLPRAVYDTVLIVSTCFLMSAVSAKEKGDSAFHGDCKIASEIKHVVSWDTLKCSLLVHVTLQLKKEIYSAAPVSYFCMCVLTAIEPRLWFHIVWHITYKANISI